MPRLFFASPARLHSSKRMERLDLNLNIFNDFCFENGKNKKFKKQNRKFIVTNPIWML